MPHHEMEAELTCPICMELFRQPRRLQCGHSYCHSCISSMINKNAEQDRSYMSFSRRLICPECRDVINLDYVEGIEAIPLDFKLSKLVELFQFMKKSDDSDSDDVSSSASAVKSSKSTSLVAAKEYSSTETISTSSLHCPSSSLPSSDGNVNIESSQQFTSTSTLVPAPVSASSDDNPDNNTSLADGTSQLLARDSTLTFQNKSTYSKSHQNLCDNLDQSNALQSAERFLCASQPCLNFQREGRNLYHSSSHLLASERIALSLEVSETICDVDESCLGAVGGIPLSESFSPDLHKNKFPTHTQGCERPASSIRHHNNFENLNESERDVEYIDSAFSPTVTTAPQQLSSTVYNLDKSAISQSYSEFPKSDVSQNQFQERSNRAQSLPLETRNGDANSHDRRRCEGRQGQVNVVASQNKKKRPKKKKGLNWKKLFTGDSSSSDEANYSSGIDETDSQQFPEPEVKRGLKVTRILKSIIFSDSSSSDWSDDNENEKESEKIRKKIVKNQKTVPEPVGRHNAISSETGVQSNRVEVSLGNTDGIYHFERHQDYNNESPRNSSLQDSLSNIPSINTQSQERRLSATNNTTSTNDNVLKNLVSNISKFSDTQSNEIVTGDNSHSSLKSNTVPKEVVLPSNPCTSIDSNTQLKRRISPEAANLASPKDFHSNRNTENVEEHENLAREPHELNVGHLSAGTDCAQAAPSHYDNVHNTMQVGMSELDINESPCVQVNVHHSPLPADPTLYDNMMNGSRQPSNARTLYDNISDADLVRCRLEAEAALNQETQSNSAAEIDNLKTGFEDMERSVSATEARQSGGGFNFQEEPSPLNMRSNTVTSPAVMQEVSPHLLRARPNPADFEIENLKEDLMPSMQRLEVSLASVPVSSPHLHSPANTPQPLLSLYDNVREGNQLPKPPTVGQERNRSQLQNVPMHLHSGENHLYPQRAGEPLAMGQDWVHRQSGSDQSSASMTLENTPQKPSTNLSQLVASEDPSMDGACGTSMKAVHGSQTASQDHFYTCRDNDDNNNVNMGDTRNSVEEDDDINDEETDPGARMLQPRRKPRSKFRKFITSLLSLSSSSEDDEPYYVNNTSSSSKSSDW